MKRKVLLAAAVLAIAAACASHLRSVQKTEFLLDTYITMSARGFGAQKAVNEAFDEIRRFEEKSSVYRADSEISRLNANGFGTLDESLASLLNRANGYSEKTFGAFDITTKPLSDLWNIKNFKRAPSEFEIGEVMPKIGYKNVNLIQNDVILKNGAQIDLGGIAKGYLADQCAIVMQKHSVKSAVLDLGGNIYVCGTNGKSMKIGLQNPVGARGEYFGYVEGKNISVVTSGGYERFAEADGKKYSHIISPFDGKCAESGVISASVIGTSSEKCDAFATAICVLGVKKGIEIINSEPNVECVVVDENFCVYLSDGAEFTLTDENFTRGN